MGGDGAHEEKRREMKSKERRGQRRSKLPYSLLLTRDGEIREGVMMKEKMIRERRREQKIKRDNQEKWEKGWREKEVATDLVELH